MKFREKPVVIDAEQYAHPADNVDGVLPGFVSGCENSCPDSPHVHTLGCENSCPDSPHIHTLEGPMRISIGDWVLTFPKGNKETCDPTLFDLIYERVS